MRLISLILFTWIYVTAPPAFAQTIESGSSEEVDSIFEPTKRVIVLLNRGEVGTVWDEASKFMREQKPRLVFISGVRTMHAVAGELKARQFREVGFLHNLEDGPKGRYAAVFFNVEFFRFKGEEKLVFYKEGMQWKLIGYFLTKRYVESEQRSN